MAERKRVTINVSNEKRRRHAPRREPFSLLDLPEEIAARARDIWLAGLGAMAAVEDEGAKAFDRLVARGETWERENRGAGAAAPRQAKAVADAAEASVEDAAGTLDERVARAVEASVEGVLHRLGVPTRGEVRDLSQRLEQLTLQVERLAERLEGG